MVRLGEIEFDPQSGEVSRGAEVRRLEPQPAKVLGLLAERGGEVVSHEELRALLWGADTHVDFERGLRYCIAQIRAALGETAQKPRFLETLPKRGYRLIPPTTPPGSAAEPASPARSWRRVPLVVAVLLVLGAGLVVWQGWQAEAGGITVAVVPFDNETGDTGMEGPARGFSDAVVARLAQIDSRRLAVIGNAGVLFVPRERRDLAALGAELGAQFVILGQVQRPSDGGLSVIAHLIRVADGKHLWANRLEQRELPTLDFQAQVAEQVAAGVESRLLSPDGER